MNAIFTPFVIKTSLLAAALMAAGGLVAQGASAFTSFANAEHARQAAIIELAASTR